MALSIPAPGYSTTLPYKPITYGSQNDVSPSWSPDGKLIAYSTDRSGGWQIHVISDDGANDRQLTPSSINASDPSWNPNSSAVAFWSQTGPVRT